jgi:putative hemolysin
MENSNKLIDVSGIFKSKNPGLHRFIPSFVFRLISKIVYEDEVNRFIEKNGHLYGIEFARETTRYLNTEVIITGLNNLDSKSRYAFAANHSLGGLEGVALAYVLGDYFGSIKIPVNDILMNLKNLDNLFIPLNLHGRTAKEAFRQLDQVYASAEPVLMFPSGKVSRKIKGTIKDGLWHKTFLTKAIQHQRDVVPVFVGGRNSNLFYSVASLRTFLGINANIEMFLLPHELFSRKEKELPLIFGEPIPYTYFDKRFSQQEWAEKIKEYVYILGKGETKSFAEFVESQ